jgi:large subunit ribosomal protein L15
MAEDLRLHTLKPAQARKDRKRVGRGLGSGKGRYSGRGIKGQKSRAGSHKMPAEFEGGQTRIFMRLPKLRGNTSKDAMPIGPFRTTTVPVNVAALDAFDDGAEVTPESLVEKGLIKNTRTDVKLLGQGELKKKLTVRVHAISASAREKVEAAGGSVSLLKEPKVKKQKQTKPKPAPAAAAEPEPAEETKAEVEAPTEEA